MTEEYNKLNVAAIALGTLAIVCLVAIIVTQQFGVILREDATALSGDITPVTSTAVSLGTTYLFPQTLTGCGEKTNNSNTTASSCYTIAEGTKSTGGTITLSATAGCSKWNGATINCTTLTYKAANSASTAADHFETGLGVFASFCGVVALALVGKMIVNIFRKKD